MKAKSLIIFLIIGLLSMTNCDCAQAQNKPSDKQAITMLKEFYTVYITELSKWPINSTELNTIKKKYCTSSLLSKIKAQFKSGQLSADPFLQAQDFDISWLKTLSVNRDSKKLNGYNISYIDSEAKEKVVIRLTVIKQGDGHKIASIR
jgi:hypothetical protein